MTPRTRAILLRLAVCLGVTTAAAPTIVACQPTVVIARFPDGGVQSYKEIGPEHTQYDLIGAGDRTCATIALSGAFCPNWTPPHAHTWHQHTYGDCIGPEGSCYWVRTPAEWHDFYAYEFYPNDTYSQGTHDFLLMSEASAGV